MDKQYFVYILASKKNGTLYIGMTEDLVKRVWQHKNKATEGFTNEHTINLLVYYESTTDPSSAITREKLVKRWKRQWKIELIEKENPNWNDLFDEII